MYNNEFPLTLPRLSGDYIVFLGSVEVRNLLPKAQRVVFPPVSRVPTHNPNQTNACILMYIDSGNNVAELNDGPQNLRGDVVPMGDIQR
jgi:hypothetical protein